MITGSLAEKLLDASPDAHLIVRRDGVVLAASASTFTVFGWLPSDLVGQSVRVLVPDSHLEEHERGFSEYWQHPPVHRDLFDRSALIGRRKEGGDCLVQIALVPLEDDVVGCICRDVRSRMQATAHASGVMLSSLKDLKEAQGSGR